MSHAAMPPATIRVGDREVRRMGFGAMRLPGEGVWGPPRDLDAARAVLRRAIELGVNLIDSAWYYGPDVSHSLIAEVLHPYPDDLVIACKLGAQRQPDRSWTPYLRPEQLRDGCERDLRLLRLERIEICHLRLFPGADVPFLESLDAMIDLAREGKIGHVALSNVTVAQLDQARERTPIAAVQNQYNVAGGIGGAARHMPAADDPDAVLDRCAELGIAFLPFFPLAMGKLGNHATLAAAADRHQATAAQLALAWLLARSPAMLPIPGTSTVAHLDENWAARSIALTVDESAAIAAAARA